MVGEGRIDQRLQDLQQGLLDQPIRHRRDPQFPHPATRLGDLHPAHRLGPVTSRLQFLSDARPLGLERLPRLRNRQPIDPRTATIGLDPFPGRNQVRSREHLRQQVASPQAFGCLARQPCFITPRGRHGFTVPTLGSPRLPRLLMPCTTKRHARRLSVSFGPSPHSGGYYGLG